jgi:AcrR family transcriptional regulator
MKREEMMEGTRARLIAAARKAFAEQGYHAASMDQLTADAGLTRGALYHHFGGKRGLLEAVVEQIDTEMAQRLRDQARNAGNPWQALLDEGVAYIQLALEPEFQRIVLLDGPAVLGDPAGWPSQNACLVATISAVEDLVGKGAIVPVDPEAAARLLNGAALNAALWIAASENREDVAERAIEAFTHLATGLLRR